MHSLPAAVAPSRQQRLLTASSIKTNPLSPSTICVASMAQAEGDAPVKQGFFASLRRKSTAAITVASAETKQVSSSMFSSFKHKDWKGDAGRIKDKLLLQTIGGEAALLPEMREDVISTGVVKNYHTISAFLVQLHAAVKAIGDAETKAAREHDRMAALCTPFNLELPFAASVCTLSKLHSARAAECRGLYGLFHNLSIEEKARRISEDIRFQGSDADAFDPDIESAAAVAGDHPRTPIPFNVLSSPYSKLEASLSALISGPLFSLGRYRTIYRDAHRDATIQSSRVSKMKEGDKQYEAEQRSLQEKMEFWEETKNELVAEWQVTLGAFEQLQTQLLATFLEGEKEVGAFSSIFSQILGGVTGGGEVLWSVGQPSPSLVNIKKEGFSGVTGTEGSNVNVEKGDS